jgi:LysR family transcriptional regulator of gallate degradation
MELRHLPHFLAASRHGSLRQAAESMGISQPSLTKSIGRLEAALHVKLFDRHARGIRLTAVGEALLLHAQTLEQELRLTGETIRELRSSARWLVRLGAGPSMSAALLPLLTQRLLTSGASIKLVVRSGLNDTLLKALQAGDLDFAITTMPARPASTMLVHEKLFSDRVVVIARAGHPLGNGGVQHADLRAARWILPNDYVLTNVRLKELFREHGLGAPDVWVETDSISYLLEAVACTDLLSYVPTELLAGHKLTALDVPGFTWKRTVGLSSWRRRTVTPASRLFLSVLGEVTRELHSE